MCAGQPCVMPRRNPMSVPRGTEITSMSGKFAPIIIVAVASGVRRLKPVRASAPPTSVWQMLSIGGMWRFVDRPAVPLAILIAVVILNHMVQYSKKLDIGFSALSDPTRRGILERLGGGDATITDLAETFEITLTGIKKHVHVLEEAGLVTTEKIGRARVCRLGPRTLDQEAAYIASYRRMLEDRLNRLEDFLERTK